MLAKVVIEKSFDSGKKFTKQWDSGDFQKFMEEEGEYLDRLATAMQSVGKDGDEFEVVYRVSVKR